MKHVSYLLVVGAVLGISACAGPGDKRPAPELAEHFSTEIAEDGSKMFVYQVTASASEKQRSKGGARNGAKRGGKKGERSSQGGEARSDRLKTRFYTMLDETLAQSGYCREGYMTLESEFGRGRASLRGECREAADEADRKRFVNPA